MVILEIELFEQSRINVKPSYLESYYSENFYENTVVALPDWSKIGVIKKVKDIDLFREKCAIYNLRVVLPYYTYFIELKTTNIVQPANLNFFSNLHYNNLAHCFFILHNDHTILDLGNPSYKYYRKKMDPKQILNDIKECGLRLHYYPTYQNNEIYVKAAISSCVESIVFASEELRLSKSIAIYALHCSYRAFCYLEREFQTKKFFNEHTQKQKKCYKSFYLNQINEIITRNII